MGWKTECWDISNNTASGFFVVDGEDPNITLTIPANLTRSFGGTIIPWCANAQEVRSKAFRFFRGGAAAFYVYQVDPNIICTSRFVFGGTPPVFPGPTLVGGVSRVYITIDASGSPTAAAF
jgi:hypothetical protein